MEEKSFGGRGRDTGQVRPSLFTDRQSGMGLQLYIIPMRMCVGGNVSVFQQADSPPWLSLLQPCSQSCLGKPLCPQTQAGKSGSPGRTQSAHLGLALPLVQQLQLFWKPPHVLQPGVGATPQMSESESDIYIFSL